MKNIVFVQSFVMLLFLMNCSNYTELDDSINSSPNFALSSMITGTWRVNSYDLTIK